MSDLTLLAIGGPTALVEFGDLRILTDPTFDDPGPQPRNLEKLAGPAVAPDAIDHVDIVLLSHDQHPDNLDAGGRAFLERANVTLTTSLAAERLGGNAVGLEPWAEYDVPGHDLTVTAVPALHGPEGAEEVSGPVTGFVLSGPTVPTLYVSGDNASLRVVREIAGRLGPIDLAVLFAGAARVRDRFDGAPLTLTAEDAAAAAQVLGARAVLPVHFHGWAHFSEGADELIAAFARAGLSERLVLARPGERVAVP